MEALFPLLSPPLSRPTPRPAGSAGVSPARPHRELDEGRGSPLLALQSPPAFLRACKGWGGGGEAGELRGGTHLILDPMVSGGPHRPGPERKREKGGKGPELGGLRSLRRSPPHSIPASAAVAPAESRRGAEAAGSCSAAGPPGRGRGRGQRPAGTVEPAARPAALAWQRTLGGGGERSRLAPSPRRAGAGAALRAPQAGVRRWSGQRSSAARRAQRPKSGQKAAKKRLGVPPSRSARKGAEWETPLQRPVVEEGCLPARHGASRPVSGNGVVRLPPPRRTGPKCATSVIQSP